MLREPRKDAIRMVHMLTRQLLGFDIDHELIFTHGAEIDRIEIEKRGGDFDRRD